jgi:diguanylate cyclase (GGDEF)-like protein
MRLRTQLFLVLAGLFLAALVVILLVSANGTRRYLEEQLASHAQDAATTLSITLGQSLGKGDRVLAQTQVSSVFDRGYFKRIDVLGADRSAIVVRELPEKIEGVPMWFVRWLPIQAPPGEAFVGSGWRQLGKVMVVSQPTFAYQHLWSTSLQLLGWLLAICLAALAVLQGGLQFILQPLRAIEKTARDVQAKKFEQIAQHPRAPELASVVRAMNQMSRRVGEMLEAETSKAQSLQRQAYEDELTGLANRRGFALRLVELLQGEFHFALGAVISVELDDMRLLHRSHGFASGEAILRTVATTAQALFGSLPVTILARNNEFNFSFVLADVTLAQATALGQTLRAQILARLADNEAAQHVGIQTGVAFFTQRDERSHIFARLDLAVESARQSERNGFAVLNAQTEETSSLGSFGWRTLISSALVEKRWRLLFQPVLALDTTRRVLQTECMARLIDNKGALVPAANFLPMAARHQLMPEVDKAMLSLAFERLRQDGFDQVTVAVNLSPQSLGDAAFMAWLELEAGKLGRMARFLAIEVSEFGAVRNVPAAQRTKALVQRLGGRFGIDHFGLEPKALELLRQLVPDYVKLSGALMADLSSVETATDMLLSFVTLAHSLDVMVIAQQLENEQQLSSLQVALVDAGQGYYFGAPQ